MYNDYMKPYASAMTDIAQRCIPVIEKRMGVPLAPGMGSKIALLATGGGGFSSGGMVGRLPETREQHDRIYHARIGAFLGTPLC